MGGIIEARGLYKKYGDHVAVDHVDLSIPEGTFFGIVGPNGAGKTTLLEMIEGIRKPDDGEALVMGDKVWPRNPEVLPRIGVQFQSSAFFPKLKVREQIDTFAELYGADTSRSEPLLEQFGLTEKADVLSEDLSGGQQQRLSIACSLVHDPAVVFLDEPTAALDPQARRNLWDVLREINREGRTVVLTTHYMEEAENLCDTVAILDKGKILTSASPRELVRQIDAPHRISIDDGLLEQAQVESLPGVEQVGHTDGQLVLVTHEPAQVLARLAELHALDGIQVVSASLEDVFLELTGREYRA